MCMEIHVPVKYDLNATSRAFHPPLILQAPEAGTGRIRLRYGDEVCDVETKDLKAAVDALSRME